MKAILEGVACRTAEVVAAMAALVPSSAAVSIDGGLSRNCYFTQFLADVLEREVRVADNAELTGTGTARLAALAYGRPVEAVGSATVVRPEIGRASCRERVCQ